MKATPASRPLIRAQSGVSVMSPAFLATPSLIRFAAVRGTKCASVVQLVRIVHHRARSVQDGEIAISICVCFLGTHSREQKCLERLACVACGSKKNMDDTEQLNHI